MTTIADESAPPVALDIAQPLTAEEREEFVLALMDFLGSKRCQLWGASFAIWEGQGRRKAAEWIADLLDDISTWEPE